MDAHREDNCRALDFAAPNDITLAEPPRFLPRIGDHQRFLAQKPLQA